MAETSKIEWTDATWNPITGCSVVSPGCTNCYAMKLAGTRLQHHPSRAGLTIDSKAGPVWNGQVRLNEEWLTQPLRWKRPRMIFVCAHGDLFHESVPNEWIDRVFAVMALAPQHTFQVLTKRAARMREYCAHPMRSNLIAREFLKMWGMDRIIEPRWLNDDNYPLRDGQPDDAPMLASWPLPNAWLGVSVEDQARADERVPDLLATPAAVRFVSAEPLLGPVDFGRLRGAGYLPSITYHDALEGARHDGEYHYIDDPRSGPRLDWIIVGGESGPSARPMHPDWARSIRDQCAAAGVPFFFKQWGEWASWVDRERDDPDWRLSYSSTFAEGIDTRWLNIEGGSGFHGDRFHIMAKRGKTRAGRLLDGIEHNGTPEVRP